MVNIDKSILKKRRELIDATDSVLIGAGAGMSVPAGINYYDTQLFAELFPGLVKKGYKMQYELIVHHAVNNERGWTPAVKELLSNVVYGEFRRRSVSLQLH